jgi:hypothetical protein
MSADAASCWNYFEIVQICPFPLLNTSSLPWHQLPSLAGDPGASSCYFHFLRRAIHYSASRSVERSNGQAKVADAFC